MPRHEAANELVDVDIDAVKRQLDRSLIIEKDGEEYVVGHSIIDNLDDVLEAVEAKTEVPALVVPRWLAKKYDWPEAVD